MTIAVKPLQPPSADKRRLLVKPPPRRRRIISIRRHVQQENWRTIKRRQ
jgi:hypothetical protein